MNKRSKYIIFAALLVFGLFFSDDTFAQCAMCRKNAEGSNVARGLNTGILYLMAIPYFMIAFIFREQIKAFYKRLRSKPSVK